MSDVLYICIEILKLLANLFCFIFFIEGDEIKENYFSYQVNKKYSAYSVDQKQLIR